MNVVKCADRLDSEISILRVMFDAVSLHLENCGNPDVSGPVLIQMDRVIRYEKALYNSLLEN